MSSSRLRLVAFASMMSIAVVTCGEQGLLDGLGERSQDAVLGETTTTVTFVADESFESALGIVAATDVRWWNDTIEGEVAGEPSYVIASVFGRGDGANRFIQASRTEIASALPKVRFPSRVPDEIQWVTSQLVYDISSGLLDVDTSAAFGLWSITPYTVTEGRVAVLRVGPARSGSTEDDIIADPVAEGLSLNWVTGPFRYELFCRQSLPEELCWNMAETSKMLEKQLPAELTVVS